MSAGPVFISYSRRDEALAREVHDRLVAGGVPVWMDQTSISPGASYTEEIAQAIGGARAVVLLFTDAANASREIHKEIQLASNGGVPIIPVRLTATAYHPALAYHLSAAQWVDATGGVARAVELLLGHLSGTAGARHVAGGTGAATMGPGGSARATDATGRTAARPARRARGVALAGGGVTAVVLAAALWWGVGRPEAHGAGGAAAVAADSHGTLATGTPSGVNPAAAAGAAPGAGTADATRGATGGGMPTATGPRVSVMYFDFGGGDQRLAGLSKGLADMMVSDLRAAGTLDVVERERLQAVLTEIRFQQGTTVDQGTAVRIGKLLGAEYLVFGSYFELFGTLRLDAKLVRVETGQVAASHGVDGPMTDFSALQSALAARLLGALPADSRRSPEGRAAERQGPALAADAVLAYSAILDAWDDGRRDEAMTRLAAFRRAHPDFAPARRLGGD